MGITCLFLIGAEKVQGILLNKYVMYGPRGPGKSIDKQYECYKCSMKLMMWLFRVMAGMFAYLTCYVLFCQIRLFYDYILIR